MSGENNSPVTEENTQQNVPAYRIRTQYAQELSDYTSIAADLNYVIQLIEIMLGRDVDHNIRSALFSAALIRYRRCFNTGLRKNLRSSDLEPFEDMGALNRHEYLMNQASKLIAHSVNSFEDCQIGALILNDKIIGLTGFLVQYQSDAEEGLIKWKNFVVLIVEKIVEPRIAESKARAYDVAKNTPIEKIKEGKIIGYVVQDKTAAGLKRD